MRLRTVISWAAVCVAVSGLSACGSADNGGTVQRPPTSGGGLSTSTTSPPASTLPGAG